jgi:hypothetical protein
MAKVNTAKNNYAPAGARKKRPGIVAKKKTSKLKTSKNYVKRYRSQGRP